ncbi:MAG: metallophosphoesterase [Anaerovoracaceae bacterium]
MIYFTSDLHFGHRSAIKLSLRPFADEEEMTATLIANYNSLVLSTDTVYLLGDITYRIDAKEANALISRLHGRKILVLGNHDKSYEPALFEEICDFKTIKYNTHSISLMHYPMLEWPKSRHGSIHLHGHIHSAEGKAYDFGGVAGQYYNQDNISHGVLRYDVGVDAHHYFPVSIEQILAFMGL